MFDGQLGVNLLMLLGDSVPLPAPYEMVRALTRAEVTSDAQNGDGFQITFALSKEQPIEYSLLQGGALDPPARVILAALVGVVPQVLIDGIITHHQHAPSDEPGESMLTVTGKDVSVMLDLEEKNEKYDNQPDFLIVTRLLASYAKYGLVPQVTPTTDVPIMLDRIPRQHETDLQFIQRMATRNGFVFYVEPLTIGVNRAYWGPPSRAGLPQPALTLGPGPAANLKSMHFTNDALAPVGTTGTFVEPITKSALPIPPLPSLRIPPLVLKPASPLRKQVTRDTANRNPASAATAVLASSMSAADPVSGSGEVDTVRYGNILRARQLVGIRGVGLSYDGNYYVRRVTHTIESGDYKQSFEVSREGTGALLPVVIPS
ncbi:MAG TPA: hypothetical protein VI670_24980 [Thermoanaerobaculia bacterium]|jgi:hypothetical protein